MKYINELIDRRPHLENIKNNIEDAYKIICDSFRNNGKILICGNGGSSSDSAHIMGELMKGFKKKRQISNDFNKNLEKVITEFTKKNNCNHSVEKLKEMNEVLEQGLPTIDITAFSSLNTAFANDKNADYIYGNLVLGLGKKEDTLIAISTSGNAKNVINACLVAKAIGMKVIGLSGKTGGKLKNISDVNIVVSLDETYLIQEEHISIYHALCLDIEEEFFGNI